MVHPCPLCRLRFTTTGEREAHVRDDHASTEVTAEEVLAVVRHRREPVDANGRPLRLPW